MKYLLLLFLGVFITSVAEASTLLKIQGASLKVQGAAILVNRHPFPKTGNLQGNYKLDETSGNALDTLGLHDGTIAGNPIQGVAGQVNKAIRFDGTGDYVNLGNNYNFGKTSPFSVAMWASSTIKDTTYISKRDPVSPFVGWVMVDDPGGVSANSRLGVRLIGNSGGLDEHRVYTSADDTVLDGNWHLIGFTYDGSDTAAGIKVYIDGSPQSLTVAINDPGGTMTNTKNADIGGERDGSALMTGNADEVSIWNTVLTAADFITLYNSGAGLAY